MKNKLSHSQIAMYTTCGRKYFYHYQQRLRAKVTHGALLFGSAIDTSLNHLVKTKNLEESIQVFEKTWNTQNINDVATFLPKSDIIVYSARDFDVELLLEEDIKSYYNLRIELDYDSTNDIQEDYKFFMMLKQEKGFANLQTEEKVLYNNMHWLCLRRKGLIMLKSYNEKVLPKIKQVFAIQKPINLENNDGDIISGFLDLIVEWEDGKRYLLDNKTSSMIYEPDSAMQSQQLILYYHASKEEYKLDGVGFLVLYKNIDKNKIKNCGTCGHDGTGKRHKTCDNEVIGNRCNGEWIVSISPECKIDIILNAVPKAAEDLVISVFDEANEGIRKEAFGPNLGACHAFGQPCPYYKKCWQGSDEELIKLEKK